MSTATREEAILERVKTELLAEGYDVVLRPNRLAIPPFLGSFTPDALAYGHGKNLVVEVASQSPHNERRLMRLRELVASEPSWELRLIWTSRGNTPRSLPEADLEAIRDTLEEIERLLSYKEARAAFLLAWGCMEAVARRSTPEVFAKPQTPGRIVERLASDGLITPAEAATLRELAPRRNRLLHGDLRTEVRRKYVGEMLSIIRRLIHTNDGKDGQRDDDSF